MYIDITSQLKRNLTTKYRLAKDTGISYSTIDKLCRRKTTSVSFDTIEKICIFFNCTPNDILFFEDSTK